MKKIENFSDLVGKTITAATQKSYVGHDDSGFLLLEFSDNTSALIISTYGSYSGKSLDEYPTNILIEDVSDVDSSELE